MKKAIFFSVVFFIISLSLHALSLEELKQFAQDLSTDTKVRRFNELAIESIKGAIDQRELRGIFSLVYDSLELDSAAKIFDLFYNYSQQPLVENYARLFKARILFVHDDLDGAYKIFKKIPLDEAKFYISQIEFKKGQYKEALATLAEAKELVPEFRKKAEILKAMCYENLEKYDEALDQYSNLFLDNDYEPYHKFILYRIVKIYEVLGNRKKAMLYAQDFLKYYPGSIEAAELENKYGEKAIIQVAALSSESRAKKLKDSIQNLIDYDVFIEKAEIDGNKFYRVKVGPIPFNEADTLSRLINKRFDVTCKIFKHPNP